MIYVFDACAMIALLMREPGEEVVWARLLEEEAICVAHALNFCEVFYLSFIATQESRLQPKQSKDMMMAMLQDQPVGGDDVLGDVLTIIRGLPQDKVKKIFGEFKTETEREELHRILVALGELDNEQQL